MKRSSKLSTAAQDVPTLKDVIIDRNAIIEVFKLDLTLNASLNAFYLVLLGWRASATRPNVRETSLVLGRILVSALSPSREA